MILRLILRFLSRFSQGELVEVLLVGLQLPLFLVALFIAQLGTGPALWVLVVYFVQLLGAIVFIVVTGVRRERAAQQATRRSRSLSPTPGIVGRTAPTQGWGELAGAPGAYRELLEQLVRLIRIERLTRHGLMTDAPIVYDALAYAASEGRFDADSLAALGDQLGEEPGRLHARLAELDFVPSVALARVMQQHRHPGTDGGLSVAFAVQAGRNRREESRLLLAQLLLLERRQEEAVTVLTALQRESWDRDRLVSDLLNPFAGNPGASLEAWSGYVNEMYRSAGLEPIAVLDGDGEPFDRLTATAPSGTVDDGPLVSVVMSTWQPGAAALAAARSIMAQSWRNLELLVMDDASGPEYDAVLDEIAALDDRVRVTRAAQNAGTYVRRNEAVQLARGDFVTMQDSDDWSHPRRLELQLRHLLANPSLPANLVSALRLSGELQFAQPRGLHQRLSEPSIMFRRSVVDRIGYFDSVRRSADSEYRVRISRVYEMDVPVLDVAAPLMLMRFDYDSLSGSDLGDGWTHPTRFAYRSAYQAWQTRELQQGRTPRLPFPLEERPFPAPARISGDEAAPGSYRVVVAGDGRYDTDEDATPQLLGALHSARAAGLSAAELGYLFVPSLRSAESHLLSQELQTLVNDGVVGELALSDEAEVELLVLAHPDAALGLPRRACGIRARRVVVLADPTARGGDRISGVWAPSVVDDACERHFGVRPEWAQVSGKTAVDLGSFLAPQPATAGGPRKQPR